MVTVPLGGDSNFEGDKDFSARIFAASLSQVGFSVDTATVIMEIFFVSSEREKREGRDESGNI